MKVVWGGSFGGSMTWKQESRMKESYPKLFNSCNFRGKKVNKRERVVTPRELIRTFEIDL